MKNKVKLLIVNHSFPPNSGIGGRRWAKFTKYLFKKGVDFKVLTFINKSENESKWIVDVKPFINKVKFIKSNYPEILGIVPKSIIEKIKYKAALFYSKFKTEGNYYDKSSHCKNELLKNIERYINEDGVNTVIVSVAPFKLAYFVSQIIDKYPNVLFIADFRDPWSNNETSYGFSSLSNKRKAFEKKAENLVIKKFHKVISVSSEMNDFFKQYDSDESKFYFIPNGFDQMDFEIYNQKITNPDDTIEIIFAGTFYNNTKELTKEFEDALNQMRKNNADIYNKFKFRFFGSRSKFIDDLSSNHKIVDSIPAITQHELFTALCSADGGMLFLSEDINYSFSTKFCEYIALRKPIVVFSNDGGTAKFIENNDIGYVIKKGSMLKDLIYLHDMWEEEGKLSFSEKFNRNSFNLEVLTDNLIEVISSIGNTTKQ